MAKKKTDKKRVVVLADGARHEITGETGKYWICGETQFRKALGYEIEEIVEKAEPKKDDTEDGE